MIQYKYGDLQLEMTYKKLSGAFSPAAEVTQEVFARCSRLSSLNMKSDVWFLL